MNTLLLSDSRKDIELCARIIRRGGLVAMPTETVYGLAADALCEAAVLSIFAAKGRPADNPLIVHISEYEDIMRYSLVSRVPRQARRLADAFWPGPLTIIMPRSDKITDAVTAGLDTVAIRMPDCETARRLIKAAATPLAAPSANLSGSPSPTRACHVMDDLSGRIDAVIDGGECRVGVESTVVTVSDDAVTVLRPGGITPEQLSTVVPNVKIADAVLNKLAPGEVAASPGMKYRHYAPRKKVRLVKSGDSAFCDFVNALEHEGAIALCYESDIGNMRVPYIALGKKNDYQSQAHNLFTALRTVDETPGVTAAYVRCPGTDGVGMAVFNRLIRAAGFEVITLE